MKVDYRLNGFDELERALVDELPKATARNVLRRTALQAMKRIEARAKQLAPRDDGTLADSITTKAVKAKRQRGAARYDAQAGITVATGPAPVGKVSRANAGWQEEGTVKMAANPYMRPALDGEAAAVIGEVRDQLGIQIEKARKRIARKAARAR